VANLVVLIAQAPALVRSLYLNADNASALVLPALASRTRSFLITDSRPNVPGGLADTSQPLAEADLDQGNTLGSGLSETGQAEGSQSETEALEPSRICQGMRGARSGSGESRSVLRAGTPRGSGLKPSPNRRPASATA
jgi:hypothetical protein